MPRYSKALRRSGYEDSIEADLLKRGVDFKYEHTTLLFTTKVVGGFCQECGCKTTHKMRRYLVDFTLTQSDGSLLLIEAKGRLDGPTRTKMAAVKKCNPELDIRFMFQRNNKTGLKRTPKYSDWAEANGFPYVIGTKVPEDWRT